MQQIGATSLAWTYAIDSTISSRTVEREKSFPLLVWNVYNLCISWVTDSNSAIYVPLQNNYPSHAGTELIQGTCDLSPLQTTSELSGTIQSW